MTSVGAAINRMGRRRALLHLLAGGSALSWGAVLTLSSRSPSGVYWVSFIGAAWAFVGAGLIARWQRPEDRAGGLMVLTGFLFLMPTLVSTRIPLLWTVGNVLSNASAASLFALILAYPRGYLTSRPARVVFAGTVLAVAVLSVGFVWAFDPRDFGCSDCQPGLNLLLVSANPGFVALVLRWVAGLIIAVSAGMVAIVLTRLVRATPPARRVLWPMCIPATLFGLSHIYAVARINYLGNTVPDFGAWQRWLTATSLCALPATFLVGLVRMRARRSRVGQLVVEIGRAPSTEGLRDAIARTLGDPSVEVGFWVEQHNAYVTAYGTPVSLPVPDGRATTLLEREGRPLAIIVHDPALLDDPALIDAVGAAAGLAVEKDRLQAEVRAQLEEMRASRLRIIEATMAERQKVERDLHDGAQQRLIRLAVTLGLAKERGSADPELLALLRDATDELARAREELRSLARGIHPAVLTAQGLGAAIQAIAETSPVPVSVAVPAGRYPEAVEATAYFVVSEAMQNVAKYSGAGRASIEIAHEAATLTVAVADDGTGGADPTRGTGLRGLADRVAALDGRLMVHSPLGRGTTIIASIPCV